ncbi:MAG: ParM/StbA family protein [Chloroflexota bacterium]|nr:ParM/StbA family protein [Chloroflexota bacterium]
MAQRRRPVYGINPGHGYAKLVLLTDGHAPATITLPAVISPAQRQLAGAIRRVETVSFGDRQWWIGQDALIARDSRTALNQERVRDPVFIPVLVKGALERMELDGRRVRMDTVAQEALCVTGLPATWSVDRDLAQALVERLRAAARLRKVRVIAEPLGIVYAALLDNDGEIVGDEALQGGRVAVIDLGHHTLDIAVMQRMAPEPDSLATYQLGTARPLHRLQQRLAARYDLRELSLFAVDEAVRTGTLRVGAVREALPSGWDTPLVENARSIVKHLEEAWGSGRQFDAILVGGGGAEVPALTEAIQAQFSHAQVLPDGQIAVALGYARLGRRLGEHAGRA